MDSAVKVGELDQGAAVPWRELWSGGHVARLAVLCFGVWLHAAHSSSVATMLPSAVADIGGGHLICADIHGNRQDRTGSRMVAGEKR